MVENKDIAVLFDLDGVLIDSERMYTLIWEEINKIFPTGVENFATQIKGLTLKEILSGYFKNEDYDNVVEILYDREAKMIYQYCIGARDLLLGLKSRHIKTAIVTSSDEKKMNHLRYNIPEICSLVDLIVTGDDISKSKPDPEGYLLAAKKLVVNPGNCAVFEDSLQGVKAGKAAGAYVVGVEGTIKPELLQPYCDEVINTLNDYELPKLIKALLER